jgi:putative flippase GtrA
LKSVALINNPRERTRFLRFAAVGVTGAVVDFSVFNLLTSVFHLEGVIAQSISFVVAVINNFLWNRYWTYPDSRSKSLKRQLLQFFVVNVAGLAIRTPIFSVLEKPLARFFEMSTSFLPDIAIFKPQFLGHNLALAVAVVVVMLWNFIINRLWTYNDVE